MIKFSTFKLDNGLRVVVNTDTTTPLVTVNVLYNVGSRDENPQKTGFAHLFEHLMFSGSANIASYDEHIQKAGGFCNAFTSKDITNYYENLPVENIETALWLESDRMKQLAFNPKGLDVQRNVVCEEFAQSYLNKPYGDLWLLMQPLAYKVHPYQWCTIGKTPDHIRQATMDDVKQFFYKHYAPCNAVIAISGNIEHSSAERLIHKWFDDIDSGKPYIRNLPKEPEQTEARLLEVERHVPINQIVKTYKMCDRYHPDYQTTDLISDILSNGESSRMIQHLIKENSYFTEISASISGSMDEGLFIISGKPTNQISLQDADELITKEIERLSKEPTTQHELQKVQNKVVTSILFQDQSTITKAQYLAHYYLSDKLNMVNQESELYRQVSLDDINRVASALLKPERCSTLYYKAI